MTVLIIDIRGIDCGLVLQTCQKLKIQDGGSTGQKGQANAIVKAILGANFWKLMFRINRNRQYIPQ